MRITYSRRILDSFRKEAKRLFPLEAFAVLLGNIDGDSIDISGIFIPEDQERRCTTTGISSKNCNTWFARGGILAEVFGLTAIAEIHSHPENSGFSYDTSPSDTDWERVQQLENRLHAIFSIRRYPTGRTISRIKIWPVLPVLKEKITP
jgi:proteasome lid subunit RPN8/RPN11